MNTKEGKIFVNRTLDLSSIKAVGFDLDHTLVRYRRENFEALAFKKTLEKFIEAGYPEELISLKFDPTFVIRGLLVDPIRGNILKADRHKYVKIAFHGKKPLSREERHSIYNNGTLKISDFISVDTFFALSESQLFIELVDYMDKHPGKIEKTYQEVYKELRYFIDTSHKDGTIKSQVYKNPDDYLIRDPDLPLTLRRMIDSGKKLFLLTNSEWTYTNFMLSYALNDHMEDFPNWKDYFSYIVVGSGKPDFFTNRQPFFEVMTEASEPGLLKMFSGNLEPGKVYLGGNATLFQKLTGLKGDEILYVGDHIFGDIINSKGLFNWRTMLIVEELEEELQKLEKVKDELNQVLELISKREALDENIQSLRNQLQQLILKQEENSVKDPSKASNKIEDEQDKLYDKLALQEGILDQLNESIDRSIKERENMFHPVWGELMKVGLEKSKFAQQVKEYSCLYTSKVTNFRYYSPFKKFISLYDTLPHEVLLIKASTPV